MPMSFNELGRLLRTAKWGEVFSHLKEICMVTLRFQWALYEFVFKKKAYSESTAFEGDTWARVQVCSLSLIFYLYTLSIYTIYIHCL
jgi:hypothetical protein